MRKFLVLAFITVVLLFSTLVVSAEEDSSVVDFLSTDWIGTSVDGAAYTFGSTPWPYYLNSVNSVSYQVTYIDNFAGKIHFSFYSNIKMDAPTVKFYRYAGASASTASFVSSYNVTGGYYYDYIVNLTASSNLYLMTIDVLFPSSFKGTFYLSNFIGIRGVETSIDDVEFYKALNVLQYSTGTWSYSFTSTGKRDIPYQFSNTEVSLGSDYYLSSMFFRIKAIDDYPGYADTSTITFMHYGKIKEDSMGLYLEGSAGGIQTVFSPQSVSTFLSSNTYNPGFGVQVPFYCTQVTFDLRGYNLDAFNLVFTASVNGDTMANDAYNNANGAVVKLLSWDIGNYVYSSEEYSMISTWFNRWRNQTDSNFDDLKEFIGECNEQQIEILEQLVTSLGGSFDSYLDPATEQAEQIAAQKDQFSSANDQLDAVERPTISADFGSVDSIMNPEGMTFLSAGIGNITGVEYIGSILIIVATLALIGYIFFGKR